MRVFYRTRVQSMSNATVPQGNTAADTFRRAQYQDIGLILGPLLFAIMMLFDTQQTTMSAEAWRTAAVGVWMAIW
jgi:sodium-dependent dicarboxylate transporter 2/3/5